MIDTTMKADGASVMHKHDQPPVSKPAINSQYLTRKKTAGLALIMALGHAVPSYSEEHDKNQVFRFDIPAGNMASALTAFSEMTDMQLSYPSVLVRDVKSEALSGSYTTDQALQKLLAGSNLAYRHAGSDVIALAEKESDSTQQSLPPVQKTAATTLTAVTVTGKAVYDPNDPYNEDYAVPDANSATKTDTPIMETPVSIQVIPKAVIQDQQSIQIGDAIKNVSGVFQGFTFGGFSEEFMIRGFNTKNANYLDGFRWPVSRLSLANIERVEVVKGAASNLYGRIEPGGMINMVTKRPQATPYYALEQQFGSYDLYRTTADATGAINTDGSLLYRLNFEYLDRNSFRDFAFTDRVFVAPSLTWNISDRTQIDLDFIYSDEDTLEDHGVIASTVTRRPIDIPISRFFGEPATDKSKTETYNTGLTFRHAFSDDWKVRAKFNMQQRDARDFQHPAPFLDESAGLLNRAFYGADSANSSYFGTADVTGKFDTWGAEHEVLAGWDYYNLDGNIFAYFLPPSAAGGPIQPINIYQPVYGRSGLNLAAAQKNQFIASTTDWTGVYFQDQITLFDKLHIMGGGRYDWATQANGIAFGADKSLADATGTFKRAVNKHFSPRVGLLYQPWEWLSLYGNYVESLGAANTAVDANGSALQPETAEQYEVGFKTEFFDQRLLTNVAFYNLTKQNMAVAMIGTPFSQAIGEARSRGVEIDVTGQATDGLSLIATYAYTDATILKGDNVGNRLWNVPRNAGSLWAKYDLQQEALRGLTVGAGAYFQSQREGDTANTFELPGYGRIDALVRYRLPIAKAQATLQFNVENLLDHRYYTSSVGYSPTFINPGAPRTFMGSVKVEF
jgi:iron complex outermembrane receptor protein